MYRFLPFVLFVVTSFACNNEEAAENNNMAHTNNNTTVNDQRTDSGKGEEDLPLDENGETTGKDDSFYHPTEHGDLVFEDNFGEITKTERIHAWNFSLPENAHMTLQTSIEKTIDSVMYIYKRPSGSSRWGRYVMKNDDFEGNRYSRLEFDVDPSNEYRVIVKAYKKKSVGNFTLHVLCMGEGCMEPPSNLKEELHEELTKNMKALGYRRARDKMYHEEGIDVINGRIEGIYSGRSVDFDDSRTPGENCTLIDDTPISCSLNTEHTMPKHFLKLYLIADGEYRAAEGDLHHIFPADQLINGKRGHLDFGNTDCAEKNTCRVNEESKLGPAVGESNTKCTGLDPNCVMQVRALRQGDVARAQFYMSVRYGIPLEASVEKTLREWDKADPVDERESTRNSKIKILQGNRNPFVEDAGLVDQISDF